jgi:hypothetical protein
VENWSRRGVGAGDHQGVREGWGSSAAALWRAAARAGKKEEEERAGGGARVFTGSPFIRTR